MGFAFEITTDDIENVLRQNVAKVANSHGQTFEQIAETLHDQLDLDEAESAALDAGGDMDNQTEAAYANLRRQLVSNGTLKG